MVAKTYIETFDHGESGWLSWANRPLRPEVRDSTIISRGPWEIDPNHAPPGAGYLHLLFMLHTFYPPDIAGSRYEKVLKTCTPNRFVNGGFSNDLRNAKLWVRLKGEVNLRGAQLVLLAQGNVARGDDGKLNWEKPNYVNQALSAQPFAITPEWSEQTITLTPDQKQWVELGARHGSETFYGKAPIEEMLRQTIDIIFVLFPLDVRSLTPIKGDIHRLRPITDYELDRSRLPEGYVMLDEVRIEYP